MDYQINWNQIKFQYNPCYCLSYIVHIQRGWILSFNTTLVTVYRTSFLNAKAEVACFNTTLVTVYRTKNKDSKRTGCGFNTTLVTVYPACAVSTGSSPWFQYNPCYCLSTMETKLFSGEWSFNTTLVTVYLLPWLRKQENTAVSIQPLLLFIVISASYQPLFTTVSIQPFLLFIPNSSFVLKYESSFNTTLVTVYPDEKSDASADYRFNTTLVTVYRSGFNVSWYIFTVSIQPLLLFICKKYAKFRKSAEFQYNPCYCLSLYIMRQFS